MKKKTLIASLAFMTVIGAGAFAHPTYGMGDDDTTQETEVQTNTSDGSLQTFEQNRERQQRIEQEREKLLKAREAKQNGENRIRNNKQKVCENRQAEIKALLMKISTRATNHIAVFTKIAERTEKFYADKGNVLDNYSALVAEVATKKTAAQAAVTNLTSIAEVFTCDVTNPQASIQVVRDALHAKRDAMQAYRTAVKNLIVGVKSVNGVTNSTDAKKEDQ